MSEKQPEKPCCCETENHFRSGCLICGADLVYEQSETIHKCQICGKDFWSGVHCAQNHFVCDDCHITDASLVTLSYCLNNTEPDAALLMQKIRLHKSFSLHGPEHHSMVPAVILATLKINDDSITNDMIMMAFRRGEAVPGGSCAFMGTCGGAVGAGIAFSLLIGANPYNGDKRQEVQQFTRDIIDAVASFKAGRCCQRDCWVALRKTAEILNAKGMQTFPVSRIRCTQHAKNAECIQSACPLW